MDESEAEPAGNSQTPHPQPEPLQRLRVTFRKLGALRFLSHLDFTKVIKIILRRANAPLAYSQGFNPQPKLQYPPPLPLGVGGHREMLDLLLAERVEPAQFLADLNAIKLEGWEALSVEEVELRGDSLETAIGASTFLLAPMGNEQAWSEAELQGVAGQFEQAREWPLEVRKKKGFRMMDLKQSVVRLEVLAPETPGATARLALSISQTPGEYLKPQVAASALLGRTLEIGTELRIERLAMHLPGDAIGVQTVLAGQS
jgi:radical SAM-linked protein